MSSTVPLQTTFAEQQPTFAAAPANICSSSSSSYLKAFDAAEQLDRLQGKAVSIIAIWLVLTVLPTGWTANHSTCCLCC